LEQGTIDFFQVLVVIRGVTDQLEVLFAEGTNRFGRDSQGEGSGRDNRLRGDERACADDRFLSDLGPIQHDRSNPDEGSFLDPASMNNHTVREGDFIFKDRRVLVSHMDNAGILNAAL
jgi:hypothetical protein